MAAERKLDIFRVLKAANKKDGAFYSALNDEEKKAYVPSVTARWMSGCTDARQVMLINEFVNPYTFSLYKHPQLLWQLLTAANSGKNQMYSWNKLPGKAGSGKPNALRAVMQFYKYGPDEAATAMTLLSRDDILEIAANLGWQPDEIAKVKKEIKASKDAPDEPIPKGKQADEGPTLFEF